MLKKAFKMATITITSPLLGEVGDEEILEKKTKAIGSRSERPKGTWRGEFVKSIVYAGLDAIVTCFSLISSISAGKLSSGIYLSFKSPNIAYKGAFIIEQLLY